MIFRCFFSGLLLAGAIAGCGSKVVVDASSGGGSGTTTSTGGSGGCGGETFNCAQFCGSDFFPANAECVGGTWQCPNGTVDPATCPPSTCGSPTAGACDLCLNGGLVCQLDTSCFTLCPAVACASCDGISVSSLDCSCTCGPNGELVCEKTVEACCTTDWDCGDEIFVPCVNNVCKQPVPGACWSDAECNGAGCIDAFVCPCAADCNEPDHPGFCEGPP